MQVKLISYTRPSDLISLEGINDIQELVAYCARVSNPSNQCNTETSSKLIEYLIKHKHWSPLEMASVCLEITSTRDIIRQILRHRSFSFQEFSQRYQDPTKNLNFQIREARFQDTKNRQNSIELDLNVLDDCNLANQWAILQEDVIKQTKNAYEWAVNNGIAKEVARAVLPEGLIESRIYMNGTIRSWCHYIEVRSDVSTQKEHRDIAIECSKLIGQVFPMMYS